jgi:YbbR domain-containing protein
MLERLLSNWPLKLLALAFAFAIWVSVTGEERVVQDFSIPLQINLSDDRVVASPRPNTVTVRLRGVESLMRRLDPVPMALSVDLRDAAPGERDVQLSDEQLTNLPRGVEVAFIDPDRLSLILERRLRRELKVEATFLGQPPEGFAFYGAESFPSTIMVEGPESQVEPLELVRTNPIRLDQHTEPFVAQVTAIPVGEFVRILDRRPVEVRVDVDETPRERTFQNIPIVIIGGAEGSRTTPDRLDVTLSGPPSLVDRILPDQIRLLADVGGLEPSRQAREVQLRVELVDVPARDLGRVTVKSPTSRKVTVRLSGEGRR